MSRDGVRLTRAVLLAGASVLNHSPVDLQDFSKRPPKGPPKKSRDSALASELVKSWLVCVTGLSSHILSHGD